MAAFGATSATTQDRANAVVYAASVSAGYTPAAGLAGEFGIAAGIVGSMLTDAIPFPVGTSAAPGISFNGDSDLGFFRVGANELGVSASGANVGGFTANGIKAGHTSSTELKKFAVYSVSLTPTALTNTSGVSEQVFTVTGVVTTDKVFVNPPALVAGAARQSAALYWRVSATDTLVGAFLAFASVSSLAAAGTYQVVALQT